MKNVSLCTFNEVTQYAGVMEYQYEKEVLTARFSFDRFQVDALRLRLEEKESFLNKKSKQLQDLTEEKGTLAGEIRDMKDMLEVKERKVNVLQKKVCGCRLVENQWRPSCPPHGRWVDAQFPPLLPCQREALPHYTAP